MREIAGNKSSEIYNKKRMQQTQQGVWKWTEKLIDLDQGELGGVVEEKTEEKVRETLLVAIMGRYIWTREMTK